MVKRKNNKQPDNFLKRFQEKWGDEYSLASDYNGRKKPISVLHVKCGEISEKKYASSAIYSGCRKCSLKNRPSSKRMSQQEFESRVNAAQSGLIVVTGTYTGSKNKVMSRCTVCWDESERSATHLIRGSRCSNCLGRKKLDTASFREKISGLRDGQDYELVGEYVNDGTDVIMRHKSCGKEFDVRPNHFVGSESRCPFCKSESRGERLVRETLESMGLKFSRQHTFSDCRRKSALRFDFAVFRDGGKIVLIEFDGDQHYEAVGLFGGEQGLEYIRENDRIKEEYCASKGHKLIRLRESDIPDIRTKIEAALAETRRPKAWTT